MMKTPVNVLREREDVQNYLEQINGDSLAFRIQLIIAGILILAVLIYAIIY